MNLQICEIHIRQLLWEHNSTQKGFQVNKKELNKYADRELYEIKKCYKKGELYEYLSNNVHGINYEKMELDLSSYSYADLYKEKIYVNSFSKRVSRTIPSEICLELREILSEFNS